MKRLLKTNDLFTIEEKGKGLLPRRFYVVVSTEMTGGGTGHGPHDIYPDGHQVTAKLFEWTEGKAVGRGVKFFQSGCFNNLVEPPKVTLVARVVPQTTYLVAPMMKGKKK